MDWKSPLKRSLVIFLLVTSPAACAGEETVPTGTILVMGDSLSAAYGIEEQQGWVSLLSERMEEMGLPWSVINASVSGETSSGGLRRLPDLLETHEPDIVILQLGGNDGLRGLPVPDIRRHLEEMITLSQDAGAEVLLAGIRIPSNYGPRYTEPFFAQYRELADEHELPRLEFLLEGIAGNPGLMQNDGIHPTAEAQPMILENIWPVLIDML